MTPAAWYLVLAFGAHPDDHIVLHESFDSIGACATAGVERFDEDGGIKSGACIDNQEPPHCIEFTPVDSDIPPLICSPLPDVIKKGA